MVQVGLPFCRKKANENVTSCRSRYHDVPVRLNVFSIKKVEDEGSNDEDVSRVQVFV